MSEEKKLQMCKQFIWKGSNVLNDDFHAVPSLKLTFKTAFFICISQQRSTENMHTMFVEKAEELCFFGFLTKMTRTHWLIVSIFIAILLKF